ncbi:MAG: aldehyde ferredoxin oxidoreductase family protein [Candidatus Aminicenantes bacterium]|nr:aldehyde ferredoxin oxidoreductase family protein [Candidatus Aminicenantes bacterium]
MDKSSQLPGGYHGRILEVDLSKGRIKSLPLNPEDLALYLGGRGLGIRLFYDRVDPACDPFDPENALVIATSPLIGTNAPTAGRGHMVFKSPLTGGLGSSNCGGTWAPAFKATGYDVLIIQGKASEPVFLDITEEKVEIKSATDLWGLDVHQTTEILTSQDSPPHSRVLCIGPAGERRIRFASVMSDRNRAYGRGGAGAVWGSKNLKAIRVAGRAKIHIHDKDQYQSGAEQAYYLLKQAPATKRLLKELGTLGLIELINLIEMLPHRNFQDNTHRDEDVEKISGEFLAKQFLIRAGGCYLCPIACQRHTRVNQKRGEGPEYETTVMLGPVCDIYDLEAITLANYACNELGLDTISFGGTLACAMELFERGILTEKDTEGFDLRFGQAQVLISLVYRTAFRQGIGDLLAEGSFRFASAFSHPEFSMTIKKQEIPGYEPRASYTQALGYMTSPTGACHLKGGYAVSLAFFGGPKEIPRFSLLQSPLAIRNMHNLGIIQDTLGICRFTGFAFSTDPWARMVSGVTGLDFSTVELERLANRVATLERLFNLEAGFGPEDDTLPKRFSLEPIIVAGEERVISQDLIRQLRSDYYRARGWDEAGRPPLRLLESLGLRKR